MNDVQYACLNESRIQFETMIQYHKNMYYNRTPEISDEKFDALVDKYHQLLSQLCIPLELSVAKQVGAKVFSNKRDIKTKHSIPMGSLNKYTNENDYNDIVSKMYHEYTTVLAMPKYNGISIALQIDNDRLIKAVTRGDGIEGIDITDKVRHMKLPRVRSGETIASGDLRAEIIITNKDWSELPMDNKYANQLNAVIGICNADYNDAALCYYQACTLKTFYYKPFGSEELPVGYMMSLLESGNIDVHNDTFVLRSNTRYEYLNGLYNIFKREYPLDGLVLSDYNELTTYDGLYPINQFAVKFAGDTELFEVDHIEWNVSRRGKYTPVAVFKEPKLLSGVMVGRAAAFNAKFVMDTKLGKGAIVKVIRSGEIIPHILETVKATEIEEFIQHCTCCGTPLEFDGTDVYCRNKDCKTQNIYKIIYFFGSLGLKHFGEATVEMLFNAGFTELTDYLSRDLSDKEFLMKFDGWEETKAIKFINELTSCLSDISLLNFLVGLGVNNVSYEVWKTIYDAIGFEGINYLFTCSEANDVALKLYGIPNIGTTRIKTLVEFFLNPRNHNTFLVFMDRLTYKAILKKSDILAEYKIEFTGKVNGYTREELQELSIANGAKTTGKFNMLVADKVSTSAKFKRAISDGVRIILSKEFLEMIGAEQYGS